MKRTHPEVLNCPTYKSYRQKMGEEMPDALAMIVYFEWDMGVYAEKLLEFNSRFNEIYYQLFDSENDVVCQKQLDVLFIEIKEIYIKLANTLSEKEKQDFKTWYFSHGK